VPGNSLWHLAQHSYGDGLRYVEIYRANQRKIDNPDLIFPGQLLKLPEKGKS
jgi:nucleoid-associated protein YgaU